MGAPGRPLSFAVTEVALGRRVRAARDADVAHLNPAKGRPLTRAPGRQVVVLTTGQWGAPAAAAERAPDGAALQDLLP